ncbi:MAG: hypothetical protein ACTSXT_12845 [Candidatus Helarchaeota archaeon]
MCKNSIKYIWIIAKDYRILFQKNFIEDMKNQELYLNFFSSIIKFSKTVTHDELENIEMKDSLVNYHFSDDFFIVLVTEKNVKIKKIKEILLKIQSSFQNLFDGLFNSENPKIFNYFDETLETILKNTKL